MIDRLGPDRVVASGVAVRYGSRVALHGTSLTIDAGTIHAIIGPAGSGKTSFLRTLNLMSIELDGATVEGSVHIGNDEVLADTRVRHDPALLSRLRRRVGIVFATPQPLPRSIYENVVYGPRIAGVRDRVTLDETVERALRAAHMWDEVRDRLSLPATRLSGGQQQRLCLARTLATNPRVVLLDEPCSGLDPISTARIEDTLRSLKSQITFVLVTNSIYQAERVADETSFFLMGEHIETASTADLFARPARTETRDYLDGRFG
ncbi:MAG: phosphate ABC transporter ATP-binding protein [Gemmatimonadaceae bacterium]|nr:phosphate ABC transporter ATP-binding protein [Gemmatimonadaceae bacterium]